MNPNVSDCSKWSMHEATHSLWGCQIPFVLRRSCLRPLALKQPMRHGRLHQAATPGKTMQRDVTRAQGKQPIRWSSPVVLSFCQQQAPILFAGKSDEQAGPDISRLAPHLHQEWDHAANAHLGSITIAPHSHRKAWWRSGTCKTGRPHRWHARVSSRTGGTSCPYDAGRAVCPCNDLAHNHPEVAAEWDWEANGDRTPEAVAASSNSKAAWRCGVCGHSWSATVHGRTVSGSGCPRCGREASRNKTPQPSISSGAPHLLTDWDWEANATHGWHPHQVTLGSSQQVHWVRQDKCKLGLVHRWQAKPAHRKKTGSPFSSGKAVCACNSLAVQCPEAADLWDHQANGAMTPDGITVRSAQAMFWRAPDGNQWQQRVHEVVLTLRRHAATLA